MQHVEVGGLAGDDTNKYVIIVVGYYFTLVIIQSVWHMEAFGSGAVFVTALTGHLCNLQQHCQHPQDKISHLEWQSVNAFDADQQPHVAHSEWQRHVYYPCISGLLSLTTTVGIRACFAACTRFSVHMQGSCHVLTAALPMCASRHMYRLQNRL